jgi:LuxR family transcriptional regulator, quorum-sensing system regulator BjaR1
MSRRDLERTLEFVRSVEQAKTPYDICASLLKTVSQFGIRHILAGTIPTPGSTRAQQEAHVLLHDWPQEWWDRYFSKGYLFVDPAINHVLNDTRPFLWTDLDPLCRGNPAATRVMREATEFQLKNGFTVSLMTLDGAVAGFSLAGEKLDLAPEHHGMLQLLAIYALGRTLVLEEPPRAPLTPREQDVLRWAAEGKTDWEIGVILHISEHTSDKMLRLVRKKLVASTRAHAVAKAMRLGIIS